jgi:hypothetical protein
MARHTPIADLTPPTHVPGLNIPIIDRYPLQDRDGRYPAMIVLAKDMDKEHWRRYSTHTVLYVDDREPHEWQAIDGHYDMAVGDADEDFADRMQRGY